MKSLYAAVLFVLVVITEAQYYQQQYYGGYGRRPGRGGGGGRGFGGGRGGGNNLVGTFLNGFFLGKGLALGAATGNAFGNALFNGKRKRSVENDELSSVNPTYSSLLEESLESLDIGVKSLDEDTCIEKTVCVIMTEHVDDSSLFSQAMHVIYATPGYVESLINVPGHKEADKLWRAGNIGAVLKQEKVCGLAFPRCRTDTEIIKQGLDYTIDQICDIKPHICTWKHKA